MIYHVRHLGPANTPYEGLDVYIEADSASEVNAAFPFYGAGVPGESWMVERVDAVPLARAVEMKEARRAQA